MSSILKYAQLRLCPPMIGQLMAEACFEDRDVYLQKVCAEYDSRRLYLYKRLSQMSGVKCYLPNAAFYIMTELPVEDTNHFCQWLLSDFRHHGETIMMAPGQGFYLTPETGKNQVRIAFVLGLSALAKAMDILEAALEAYPHSTISTHLSTARSM
jgi:aspartate aminotransferase